MARRRTLALVLAGGMGGRMELLTERRAKPALPFAGTYRLVDFPLSNCHNAGISDVWVSQQYELQSLNEQLVGGRPWDLDRTRGGLRLLPPAQGRDGDGMVGGNAEAIWRDRALIREFDPDVLLVLSADAAYLLDYDTVVDEHLARGAEVTMVVARVDRGEAERLGTVVLEGDRRVRAFAYKADEPPSDLATTEVFAYDPDRLLATLDELVREDGEGKDDGSGLGDFGERLLPRMVEGGKAHAWVLDDYWRDVGTPDSYWAAHMELCDPEGTPRLRLDDRSWPLLTLGVDAPPARFAGTARLDRALVSAGCRVEGEVARSVLSPWVTVEAGAVVRDSVLLHGVTVRAGARVERAIVDEAAEIGPGARVGAADGDLVLVGEGAGVDGGTTVPPGTRVRGRRPPEA